MDTAVAALQTAGLDDEQVHVERFVSLPDEESAPAAAPTPEPAAIDEAQIHLRLDGQDHQFTCNGHETLLEAALRHKIQAPYSCQAGMCASCMCQVVQGSVHMRVNDALDQRDLDRGWVLACQAVPLTEEVHVKYRE
jgi:3-ketosteroid 9alpha-monooxygenase subunit B